jgi:hypothetical protein
MSGKRGQPTKYHDDRVANILHLIREGNTLRVAALANGITYQTLNEWRKQYPDFSDAVGFAEAQAERAYVQSVRTASVDNWQAAKFWLQARSHGDWRTVEAHEHSGPGGGPIPYTVERVDYGREDE